MASKFYTICRVYPKGKYDKSLVCYSNFGDETDTLGEQIMAIKEYNDLCKNPLAKGTEFCEPFYITEFDDVTGFHRQALDFAGVNAEVGKLEDADEEDRRAELSDSERADEDAATRGDRKWDERD